MFKYSFHLGISPNRFLTEKYYSFSLLIEKENFNIQTNAIFFPFTLHQRKLGKAKA